MPQALKLECSTNYGTIAPSSLDSRHWMYEKLKNIEARDRIIEIHCSSIIGTIVLRRPKSGDWMYEKFKNIEFSYSKWQFHCTGKHGTLSSSKWQVTSDHCTGKCGTLRSLVATIPLYRKMWYIEFHGSKWQSHCTGNRGTLSSGKLQVTFHHCTERWGTLKATLLLC